jgi:hypothetical protein
MTISAGLDRWTNSAQTTLSGNGGSITAGATTMKVAATLPFPLTSISYYRVLVDNEIMQITGGQNTLTWTVARGLEGTAAASHNDGAAVTHDISAFELNSFRQEFNVIAYGAVGDGVTDETTAFQNAINDAHAQAVGGVVFLPTLKFKIVSGLTTYSNVIFATYGATLSGANAGTVTPLINWGLTGTLSLPGALTVLAGGASIAGGLSVTSGNFSTTGTTTFHGVAYTWPSTSGSSGQFLQTDGAGNVSWQSAAGGVTSVTGTANQITSSPTTGAVVVSLPSGGTLPGSWTAASGFTVTTGGLTISAGGLTVTAGGANITGGITGTLNTAAQPNVTSLGILTSLTVSGLLSMTATAAQISGGPTSLSLRNNANSADNILITDAGAITVRSTISGVTTLTATNLAGTLTTAAQANVTSLGTLTSLTMGGTLSKGSNALTGSYNSSDWFLGGPSASGGQVWIQASDPGGSANNGDLWFAG